MFKKRKNDRNLLFLPGFLCGKTEIVGLIDPPLVEYSMCSHRHSKTSCRSVTFLHNCLFYLFK